MANLTEWGSGRKSRMQSTLIYFYRCYTYSSYIQFPLLWARVLAWDHAGTQTLNQPYTRSCYVTFLPKHPASLWWTASPSRVLKMQPARLYFEIDIMDTVFTIILLLAVLFSLMWVIYLQELIDIWFNDLWFQHQTSSSPSEHSKQASGHIGLLKTEIKLGFALFAYYTWWIIILASLAIVLFKLLTNHNFSVAFWVGIQTTSRQEWEKFEGPVQVLDSLGLTIYSIRMAVAIQQDKRDTILQEIQDVMLSKKCTVKQIQALADSLISLLELCPQLPFLQPHLWCHSRTETTLACVNYTGSEEGLIDVEMFHLGIWWMDTDLTPRHPHGTSVHWCSNYGDSRLGHLVGHSLDVGPVGSAFHGNQLTFHRFLKLFALLAVVWIWSPQFANKHVIVHSDNQPTVAVVNAKTSHSKAILILLRFLTLHCMLHNIKLTSQFIPSTSNQRSDASSCLQLSRFQKIHPGADSDLATLPVFLSLLSEAMLESLQLKHIGRAPINFMVEHSSISYHSLKHMVF